eukprot:4640188-Amphidinium_carterae.1
MAFLSQCNIECCWELAGLQAILARMSYSLQAFSVMHLTSCFCGIVVDLLVHALTLKRPRPLARLRGLHKEHPARELRLI